MKTFYTYILSNKKNGTLYIGMTNDLHRRLKEHRSGLTRGFVTKYRLTRLVYFETLGDAYSAIVREKQLKGWLRAKKIVLIEAKNPEWKDLSEGW
jgi:putative endonuclease